MLTHQVETTWSPCAHLWSRWRFLVGGQAGEVAKQSRGPVHVGGVVALGKRTRTAVRARQAVVGPFFWRATLEEVYGLEVAGSGERNYQVAQGADVFHFHCQPARIELPHAHVVDDVAGRAIVVLGEIEIGPANHLIDAEVRS